MEREKGVDNTMNLQVIALGVISLIACLVLFILEKTTPKNKRVPVKPFISYSHESVRIQIILVFIIGVILFAIGVVL
ncbi:hypothetical protein KEJ15_04085 [Candidatus Bathyarchaeota archaeon]|nr:hypothetical protein [Candidatus Bathyarchaeota archaeon]